MEWLESTPTRGNPPIARKGHTMTRLLDSSLVLVFGGEGSDGRQLNDMHVLHVERGEWRPIKYAEGPVPAPRLLHSATAISSTAMVIMYGDSNEESSSSAEAFVTAKSLLDVWLFDIRNCSWKEIKSKGNSPPRARSCHSTVLGNGLGQVPAIYLFGGFGTGAPDGCPVYRLRLGDWNWECLPVLITDESGKKHIVEKPVTKGLGREVSSSPIDVPWERESHGAAWLPGLNGMLIVAGDGGYMLDDCWLFVPSSRHAGAWRWRKLNMRMAKGLKENKLPLCAGFSVVALPTAKTRVLVWGGIVGTEGEHTMPAECSYLIDLDSMQTTCLRSRGTSVPQSRLLHGLVRTNDTLYLFGGCDSKGKVIEGLHSAKLLPELNSIGLQATDFGPLAAELAAGADVESLDAAAPARGHQVKDSSIPLAGPSTIPKGTPLSGRIIEAADFGYFVSVVINGKLYKGVLVANPLKESQQSVKGKENRDEKPSNEKSHASPQPKRIRLDPIADALPDSPQKPNSGKVGVVVDLE